MLASIYFWHQLRRWKLPRRRRMPMAKRRELNAIHPAMLLPRTEAVLPIKVRFMCPQLEIHQIVWHNCSVSKIDRQAFLNQKGCVIWITGLSGSGKSTLACAFRQDRDSCRALLPEGDFIEVYMDVPVQVCETRDPKGLYKLARAGKIKGICCMVEDWDSKTWFKLPMICINPLQQESTGLRGIKTRSYPTAFSGAMRPLRSYATAHSGSYATAHSGSYATACSGDMRLLAQEICDR